ncbi:MAG: cell division protein FtsA [Alphaproteobacteria bacterium]
MKLRNDTIAALDIGTTKTCCLVARTGPDGMPRVRGIGHQMSRGLKAGAIIDMDAVEASILQAVHAAEQMAGETVHSVLVNLSCGRPGSRRLDVEVALNGHEIGDADLRRVFEEGQIHVDLEEREVIHSIPVGFRVDDASGIRDPRGMFGDNLGVEMHVITATSGPVRNLVTCVERSHLDIERVVLSAYASGLACLVEDEMDLGATVIDMGGGTTSLGVFVNGKVVYTDVVPVGGHHVTSDIARGLCTSVADAERIKTLYGSTSTLPGDDKARIDVPPVGEPQTGEPNYVSKSLLHRIIRPRIEETFEMVRAALEASGLDRLAGRRVILTGGACQLQGVRELAALILDKQVRIGRPARIAGLAESMSGPAFSTAAGLLLYANAAENEGFGMEQERSGDPEGFLRRLSLWLKENF